MDADVERQVNEKKREWREANNWQEMAKKLDATNFKVRRIVSCVCVVWVGCVASGG